MDFCHIQRSIKNYLKKIQVKMLFLAPPNTFWYFDIFWFFLVVVETFWCLWMLFGILACFTLQSTHVGLQSIEYIFLFRKSEQFWNYSQTRNSISVNFAIKTCSLVVDAIYKIGGFSAKLISRFVLPLFKWQLFPSWSTFRLHFRNVFFNFSSTVCEHFINTL